MVTIIFEKALDLDEKIFQQKLFIDGTPKYLEKLKILPEKKYWIFESIFFYLSISK